MLARHAVNSTLIPIRSTRAKTAVVFVHGFAGDAQKTWGDFPKFVADESALKGWDVFSLGYPASFRVDVPNLWAADPDLQVLSYSLRTELSILPLSSYKCVALLAHSMGGLVAQHAALDPAVAEKLSHLILFGTPSNGLVKAALGSLFKRQFRDMAVGSEFISGLRKQWSETFSQKMPFEFLAVGGDRDQFVAPASSIMPFAGHFRRIVPGNHLEIVKPESPESRSVRLVVSALLGRSAQLGVIDSARLAVEQKDFNRAIEMLLPNVSTLDDAALVQLALALDGRGRGEEALLLLEKHGAAASSTDALGVLAGRIKRRWLAGRDGRDFTRARELYSTALTRAESRGDLAQSYYHGINVVFLDVMITPAPAQATPLVQQMAKRVLSYCEGTPRTFWRSATEGDAFQVLGALSEACKRYMDALAQHPNPRSVDSMYAQAMLLAQQLFGDSGVKEIEAVFGLKS